MTLSMHMRVLDHPYRPGRLHTQCLLKVGHNNHWKWCTQAQAQTCRNARPPQYLGGPPPRGELPKAEQHSVWDVNLAFDTLVLQFGSGGVDLNIHACARHGLSRMQGTSALTFQKRL